VVTSLGARAALRVGVRAVPGRPGTLQRYTRRARPRAAHPRAGARSPRPLPPRQGVPRLLRTPRGRGPRARYRSAAARGTSHRTQDAPAAPEAPARSGGRRGGGGRCRPRGGRSARRVGGGHPLPAQTPGRAPPRRASARAHPNLPAQGAPTARHPPRPCAYGWQVPGGWLLRACHRTLDARKHGALPPPGPEAREARAAMGTARCARLADAHRRPGGRARARARGAPCRYAGRTVRRDSGDRRQWTGSSGCRRRQGLSWGDWAEDESDADALTSQPAA